MILYNKKDLTSDENYLKTHNFASKIKILKIMNFPRNAHTQAKDNSFSTRVDVTYEDWSF